MQLWHQGAMMIMSQPLEARAGAIGGQSLGRRGPARSRDASTTTPGPLAPRSARRGLSLSDTQACRPAGAVTVALADRDVAA